MIEIINYTKNKVPKSKIDALVKVLGEHWEIPESSLVEIVFTGRGRIRSLNKKYRLQDRTTDVLSFPLEQLEYVDDSQKVLGTIIICPDVIKEQEGSYNFNKYIIHGYMHLMGYDHNVPKDFAKWQQIEKKLSKYF